MYSNNICVFLSGFGRSETGPLVFKRRLAEVGQFKHHGIGVSADGSGDGCCGCKSRRVLRSTSGGGGSGVGGSASI